MKQNLLRRWHIEMCREHCVRSYIFHSWSWGYGYEIREKH